MDKFGGEMWLRTVDEAFENYKGRRQGIINALIKDVDEFREKCDQYNVTERKYLGLYAYPDGNWEIKLSSAVAEELPYSRIYKLPKQLTDKNAWLAQVAADSDTWLFSVTFFLCSIYSWMAPWRERLFDKMNALPTVSELVKDNHKNLEVATENAKKRVKDKSTVSYHSSKNSKSNSEVQGKSSSGLVSTHKVLNSAKVTGDIGYKPIKDFKRKREGKKAITKQVLPEQSAVKPRSKALGIQTRAQTGQELPKQSALRTRSMALGNQTRAQTRKSSIKMTS
ncbi:hypothetical protein CQW23_03283 [Capsicum baccatum]|uniref:PHD finger protein ALFIN-LIKE n=1 Tax=Capsicum baccatum TaxID=33114 RepID=A0A2G2XBD4_CAPBA|nr:hypothetical protein CQW23_03283 [Capsicum baccatum]